MPSPFRLTLALLTTLTASTLSAEPQFFAIGGISGKAADGHLLEAQFGTIYTSKDGATWTEVFKGGPVKSDFSHAKNNLWRCLTYGKGRFVISGNPGLMTSTDGKTWKLADAPRGSFSVEYGNGIFIAPSAPDILVSQDGMKWERHRPNIDAKVWGKDGAGHVRKTVFGNGVFVCVGENRLGITKDGKSYIHHHLFGPNKPGRTSIAFGAGRFVWFRQNGRPQTSTDGINWEPVTIGDDVGYDGLWTGSEFVVPGKKCIYKSKGGLRWTRTAVNGYPRPNTAGNGLLVGNLGWSQSFVTSKDGGVTWQTHKVNVPSRKVYFFDGKQIIGQSGG